MLAKGWKLLAFTPLPESAGGICHETAQRLIIERLYID